MLLPGNHFSVFKMLLFDLKKGWGCKFNVTAIANLLENFAIYIECHLNIFGNHLSDVNVNCIKIPSGSVKTTCAIKHC